MKEQPKKQIQVKQRSGTVLTPNLDDASLHQLIEAQSEHQKRGHHFSQSVLIRRAIRLYNTYLKQVVDWEKEVIQTLRASKGVL